MRRSYFFLHKQKGMAALMVSMIVLLIVTMVTLFSGRVVVTANQEFQIDKSNTDAFHAAQAGVNYALGYINASLTNKNTVLTGLSFCASASSTYLLTSGTMADGSTYTMQFGCTATDINVLRLTSAGTSADGSSTRTVQVLIKNYVIGSGIYYPPGPTSGTSISAISTGATSMANSSNITNSATGATAGLQAGGSVTFANSADVVVTAIPQTVNRTTAVASYPTAVQQNVTGLSSGTMTDSLLQTTYLGILVTGFSSIADITLSPGVSTTYNSSSSSVGTNSWAGRVVYIDVGVGNTATFNGGFYAGTTTQPTLIVVNGNATVGGSGVNASTIVGSVYASGTLHLTSSATLTGLAFGTTVLIDSGGGTSTTGAVVAGSGGLTLQQRGAIALSSIASLNASRFSQYAFVTGSWRDF